MLPSRVGYSGSPAPNKQRKTGRGPLFWSLAGADATRWIERVHQPEIEAELEAPRRSLARSQPFGSAAWQKQTAERLGLQSIFRTPGRPRKQTGKARQ